MYPTYSNGKSSGFGNLREEKRNKIWTDSKEFPKSIDNGVQLFK